MLFTYFINIISDIPVLLSKYVKISYLILIINIVYFTEGIVAFVT